MSDSLITLSGDIPTTTSLIVAEGTCNEHASVLRLIRDNLSDFEEFGRVGFEIRPFVTAGGPQRRQIAVLNEQQATLLLTYLRNTPTIRDFKKRLVRAFYELKQQRDAMPAIPRSYAEALRAHADAVERAERAEHQVEELIDPAAAWLGLEEADGDYEVADAAKILSRDPRIIIGEIRLFQFMAEQRWVFRNERTDRWVAYQSQVDCGRLAEKPGGTYKHPKTKRTVKGDPTVRVTAKGLAELYKRLTVGTQLELISGGAE